MSTPTCRLSRFVAAESRPADPPFFLSVEYPEDQVSVLQTNEHVHVEQDGEIKTQ